MTVLCAAEGFTAHVAHGYQPDGLLDFRMRPTSDGGSRTFAQRTGHLPGMQGQLDAIPDRLDRTCLYVHNVVINDGVDPAPALRT